MPYLNLKGEMAKKNITIEDISKLLNMHRNSIAKKINGPSSFSIEEAFAIKKEFFPNCDMKELFKTEEQEEKKVGD